MRTMDNLQAINAITQENFNPELLEKYTGFGGIGKELGEYNYYKKLNAIIPKEEIAKIKATTKSAYYTPTLLVRFIYRALQELGFKGGNILEPAAGSGVFFKHMPKSIRRNSKILAIETDPFAARILKKLYPDVSVMNKKFEDVELKNNSVDLVVGNPPYGAWLVKDKNNPDLAKHAIHHYFASRGVRLLKQGGILAFVMDCYFMDNIKDHVRDVIEQEGASLLSSYRLPDNLFDNAKVTVDIIFIVKDKSLVKNASIKNTTFTKNTKWQETKAIARNKLAIGKTENPIKPYYYINEYYINNPQNILGKLTVVDMYKHTGLSCKDEGNLTEKLKEKIEGLPRGLLLKTKDLSLSGTSSNHLPSNKLPSDDTLNCKQNIKVDIKIQTWLSNILFKEWNKLIERINNYRNLPYRPIPKIKLDLLSLKVDFVTSLPSVVYNKEFKPYKVIEAPLKKEEYYYEIKVSCKKRAYFIGTLGIENIIEQFIRGKINGKIQYKVFIDIKE